MRLTAKIQNGNSVVKRVMIYDNGSSCYGFYYNTLEDDPCFADTWFESIEEAKIAFAEEYDIPEEAWTPIADPQEGCQHDIIAPAKSTWVR